MSDPINPQRERQREAAQQRAESRRQQQEVERQRREMAEEIGETIDRDLDPRDDFFVDEEEGEIRPEEDVELELVEEEADLDAFLGSTARPIAEDIARAVEPTDPDEAADVRRRLRSAGLSTWDVRDEPAQAIMDLDPDAIEEMEDEGESPLPTVQDPADWVRDAQAEIREYRDLREEDPEQFLEEVGGIDEVRDQVEFRGDLERTLARGHQQRRAAEDLREEALDDLREEAPEADIQEEDIQIDRRGGRLRADIPDDVQSEIQRERALEEITRDDDLQEEVGEISREDIEDIRFDEDGEAQIEWTDEWQQEQAIQQIIDEEDDIDRDDIEDILIYEDGEVEAELSDEWQEDQIISEILEEEDDIEREDIERVDIDRDEPEVELTEEWQREQAIQQLLEEEDDLTRDAIAGVTIDDDQTQFEFDEEWQEERAIEELLEEEDDLTRDAIAGVTIDDDQAQFEFDEEWQEERAIEEALESDELTQQLDELGLEEDDLDIHDGQVQVSDEAHRDWVREQIRDDDVLEFYQWTVDGEGGVDDPWVRIGDSPNIYQLSDIDPSSEFDIDLDGDAIDPGAEPNGIPGGQRATVPYFDPDDVPEGALEGINFDVDAQLERIEPVAAAPFQAQQRLWSETAETIEDPSRVGDAAEAGARAPFDLQQAAWHQTAETIDDPRGTAVSTGATVQDLLQVEPEDITDTHSQAEAVTTAPFEAQQRLWSGAARGVDEGGDLVRDRPEAGAAAVAGGAVAVPEPATTAVGGAALGGLAAAGIYEAHRQQETDELEERFWGGPEVDTPEESEWGRPEIETPEEPTSPAEIATPEGRETWTVGEVGVPEDPTAGEIAELEVPRDLFDPGVSDPGVVQTQQLFERQRPQEFIDDDILEREQQELREQDLDQVQWELDRSRRQEREVERDLFPTIGTPEEATRPGQQAVWDDRETLERMEEAQRSEALEEQRRSLVRQEGETQFSGETDPVWTARDQQLFETDTEPEIAPQSAEQLTGFSSRQRPDERFDTPPVFDEWTDTEPGIDEREAFDEWTDTEPGIDEREAFDTAPVDQTLTPGVDGMADVSATTEPALALEPADEMMGSESGVALEDELGFPTDHAAEPGFGAPTAPGSQRRRRPRLPWPEFPADEFDDIGIAVDEDEAEWETGIAEADEVVDEWGDEDEWFGLDDDSWFDDGDENRGWV